MGTFGKRCLNKRLHQCIFLYFSKKLCFCVSNNMYMCIKQQPSIVYCVTDYRINCVFFYLCYGSYRQNVTTRFDLSHKKHKTMEFKWTLLDPSVDLNSPVSATTSWTLVSWNPGVAGCLCSTAGLKVPGTCDGKSTQCIKSKLNTRIHPYKWQSMSAQSCCSASLFALSHLLLWFPKSQRYHKISRKPAASSEK